MPRPTTKSDLISAANTEFEKMWNIIDSMTEEEQNQDFSFGEDPKRKEAHWKRDKNIRDVLIHLYEWHQLLLEWIEKNKKGMTRPFLLEGYNWKTYGNMNVVFWKNHQNTSLKEAKEMLKKSHQDVIETIEQFSNEELFENKFFSWTGNNSVGSYCVSTTSSHYDWAIKKIKLHLKNLTK